MDELHTPLGTLLFSFLINWLASNDSLHSKVCYFENDDWQIFWSTVECRYNLVQYIMIFDKILYRVSVRLCDLKSKWSEIWKKSVVNYAKYVKFKLDTCKTKRCCCKVNGFTVRAMPKIRILWGERHAVNHHFKLIFSALVRWYLIKPCLLNAPKYQAYIVTLHAS